MRKPRNSPLIGQLTLELMAVERGHRGAIQKLKACVQSVRESYSGEQEVTIRAIAILSSNVEDLPALTRSLIRTLQRIEGGCCPASSKYNHF